MGASQSQAKSTDEGGWSTAAKVALGVAGVVILIAIIVIIYRVNKSKSKTEPMLIKDPTSLHGIMPLKGASAPISINGRESTYNFWINIRDWSESLNTPKCVLYRSSTAPEGRGGGTGIANPSIWLYPNENKMMVRVSTAPADQDIYDTNVYPKYISTTSTETGLNYSQVNPANNPSKENWSTNYACDIENIPLQRWVQVSVVLWNRTLDVYINGKLVRSCILPGVPVQDKKDLQHIYVGGQNTFNGYISRLKYFNRAITAKEVMDLYEKGPLPVNWWWQNLKNHIKVTLDINN
jgi:hypothetical protein